MKNSRLFLSLYQIIVLFISINLYSNNPKKDNIVEYWSYFRDYRVVKIGDKWEAVDKISNDILLEIDLWVVDIRNGYMRLKEEGSDVNIVEVALFRDNKRNPFMAISESRTSPVKLCKEEHLFSVYKKIGDEWENVTDKVLPIIKISDFFKENVDKSIFNFDEGVENINVSEYELYFVLPIVGTDVVVTLDISWMECYIKLIRNVLEKEKIEKLERKFREISENILRLKYYLKWDKTNARFVVFEKK